MLFADRFRHPKRGHVFKDELFYVGLLFGSLFGYGTGVVCYQMAPDWMWMYWMDSRLVATPVLLYLATAYHLSLFAGIMTARELLPHRSGLFAVLGVSLSGAILICIVFFNRIWHIGSTAQFQQGMACPMLTCNPFAVHPVVIAMGIAGAMATFVLWIIIRKFKPRTTV
ncbi:MAG: hypothetical protein ABIJ53_05320 [Verrucomicrobiota bacterium]